MSQAASEAWTMIFADPVKVGNPHGYLDRLRAEQPVRHLGEVNADWVVLGYRQVRAALTDETFGFDIRGGHSASGRSGREPRPYEWFDGGPLSGDPKHAAEIRRLAAKVFSPAGVRVLESTIGPAVDSVISNLEARDRVDLYSDLGMAVATEVLFSLFGLEEATRERFVRNARAFIKLGDPYRSLTEMVTINRSIGEFRRVAADVLNDAHAKAGPLIRRLVEAAAMVGQVGPGAHDELARLLIQVMAAGVHTVASGLATAVLRYYSDTDSRRMYVDEPDMRVAWIMESLRVQSFVFWLVRVASERRDLGFGRTVKPGEVVWLSPAAANRDPDVFEHPSVFDPMRDPSLTLLFGLGRHYCLGAALAKSQLSLAFSRFVERFPQATIVDGSQSWSSDVFTRTPGAELLLKASRLQEALR